MYRLYVSSNFSSAHNLRGYKGKCESLHGHNWKVEVCCTGELNELGMVTDFKVMKAKLNAVLEELDHKYLNDLEYFSKVNPTSENTAKYIFHRLKPELPGLLSLKIWENNDSCAEYSEQ